MSSDRPTSAPCGCPEGILATKFGRRKLLGGALALGTVAGLSGTGFSTSLAFAGTGYTGDTVVVLSLRGGFDGLSALIPVGDPTYVKVRPSIAVPASRAIKLDEMFALHPALQPLKPLWDTQQLAGIHAVGQLSPSRSHFSAMEDMENAAPGSHLRSGWLDRMIGAGSSSDTFSSVAMGSGTAPYAMIGPNPELALGSVDDFSLSGAWNNDERTRWTKALRGLHADAPPLLAAPANTTLAALATTGTLKDAGYTPSNGASYPKGDLGDALKDVARLVKAGLGLRAATVDIGDWDMHVDLGKFDRGWMFDKLTELGLALAAFAADLGDKFSKVTLVTLSEFGRRVAENGSGGLDHGHGNACFVLGGSINGGQVYGKWPGLSDNQLDSGDLAGVTDYRTVLAEILEKRASLSTAEVFPGLDSSRLGIIKSS